MISRRITSTDLVEVTGYTRHQLRNILSELPGCGDRERVGAQRVAQEYTAQDLTVVAVCCALEAQCGLRRDVIAKLVPDIRRVLTVPRPVTVGARLVVAPNPPTALYLDDDTCPNLGTVLPLSPLLQRIDQYLLGDLGGRSNVQRPLDLGPVAITRKGAPAAPDNRQSARHAGKKNDAR